MEQATGSDEFQSQGGGLADSVNLVDVYLSLRVRHVIQTASETKTKNAASDKATRWNFATKFVVRCAEDAGKCHGPSHHRWHLSRLSNHVASRQMEAKALPSVWMASVPWRLCDSELRNCGRLRFCAHWTGL